MLLIYWIFRNAGADSDEGYTSLALMGVSIVVFCLGVVSGLIYACVHYWDTIKGLF